MKRQHFATQLQQQRNLISSVIIHYIWTVSGKTSESWNIEGNSILCCRHNSLENFLASRISKTISSFISAFSLHHRWYASLASYAACFVNYKLQPFGGFYVVMVTPILLTSKEPCCKLMIVSAFCWFCCLFKILLGIVARVRFWFVFSEIIPNECIAIEMSFFPANLKIIPMIAWKTIIKSQTIFLLDKLSWSGETFERFLWCGNSFEKSIFPVIEFSICLCLRGVQWGTDNKSETHTHTKTISIRFLWAQFKLLYPMAIGSTEYLISYRFSAFSIFFCSPIIELFLLERPTDFCSVERLFSFYGNQRKSVIARIEWVKCGTKTKSIT